MKKTEILFVGRGGQGLVTAAPILGQAYLYMKKHVLAFAKFGVERRGAPIMAFLRVSDKKLNDRWEIERPDIALFSSEDLLGVFPAVTKNLYQSGHGGKYDRIMAHGRAARSGRGQMHQLRLVRQLLSGSLYRLRYKKGRDRL